MAKMEEKNNFISDLSFKISRAGDVDKDKHKHSLRGGAERGQALLPFRAIRRENKSCTREAIFL